MNFDLESLNEAQRAAVEHGDGPILILAGAGSGKTRVLTYRIANLILRHQVDPSQIFAVTFTNKAAAEMRHRVESLLGGGIVGRYGDLGVWVSTFHSACVRILRSDIRHLGYQTPFTIYDSSDQLSVIKAAMKELNIADGAFSPKAVAARINKLKNDGIDQETYKPEYGGYFEDAFVRIFARYTEMLKVSAALDFADLILVTVRLFQKVPQVLESYQRRFPYLLIDEYQDTNHCQYLLMKLLAGKAGNICAVGDEDQSIYGWRGADINNILGFERDFPNAKIFKLEENYRSTRNIIEAASKVIAFNTERHGKQLWTRNDSGEKIRSLECYDEYDEANKLVAEIGQLVSEGEPVQQIAVFYRTNAQSRLIEDMLRAKGLNYQVFGGLKFYERLEVKDALAYLKLIANPSDDVSFRRIINVPARGIGAVSLERLVQGARQRGETLYETLGAAVRGEIDLDLGRSRKNFQMFHQTMETFRSAKSSLLPSDLINLVLEESGYRKALVDENSPEAQSRLENLAELRKSIVEFELRSGAEDPQKPITLEGFLEEIALVSDIDKFDAEAPALKMMTIHMAKGLEFDVVFIVGLEEELFPNIRSWDGEDATDVEEERRLFYVGMTRARRRLYFLHAKNRVVFGTPSFRVSSRFLDEVPDEFVEFSKADYFQRRRSYLDRPGLPLHSFEIEARGNHEDDFSQVYADADEYAQTTEDGDSDVPRAGTKVVHPVFGEGVVRKHLGGDKLMVEFAGRGVKKISLKFAQLKGAP